MIDEIKNILGLIKLGDTSLQSYIDLVDSKQFKRLKKYDELKFELNHWLKSENFTDESTSELFKYLETFRAKKIVEMNEEIERNRPTIFYPVKTKEQEE